MFSPYPCKRVMQKKLSKCTSKAPIYIYIYMNIQTQLSHAGASIFLMPDFERFASRAASGSLPDQITSALYLQFFFVL